MDKRMRKSQKKQIEDTIKLLDKAHNAVKKAMETGNQEIALTLLEQCQDSAIQIGSLIEDTEGEGFITIRMLESYCEQVYQAYELIRQQSANIGKVYKNLHIELIRISNSVKNDITVKTVAVFLPYKASMWDSLESVWQAADADPDCDAYVIPIPYYDKNPDGSFKEMHYEGNEYPDYVPIVSWEEYNLATEHPDVIFIHNPYDGLNMITSVPPAYYSKELRKCTDQLVYIPYFVLEETGLDNEEAVEGLEHFCDVSAAFHADLVIVQSEKIRQIYIDVMSKIAGEDTREIWKDKIWGLGSPKLDKVLSTNKEELDIPEEWLRIIERTDGSRKKIIFYNTSVSALLQHGEKMMEKIKSVLEAFKENQDKVALLWRPHPLIKATIKSMRPKLWIEYDEVVRQYKEGAWGIYDDTADVNRAIVISDAYYGDPSSIVKMYQETNKPILLQDVAETIGESINFYSCAIYADRLWFISTARKFMNIDLGKGKASYVRWIEKQPWEKQAAWRGKLFVYEASIYWIGHEKKDLHQYNTRNNEYTHCALLGIEAFDLDDSVGAYIYGGMLYFCQKKAPYIITVNVKSKKCEIYSESLQINMKSNRRDSQIIYSMQVHKWIYFFQDQNLVMKFDLDSCCCECITVPNEISNIVCAIWRNNVFYVLTREKTVYLWDEITDKVEQIYHCVDENLSFGGMEATRHKIFLLPALSEKILIIDTKSLEITELMEYPDDLEYMNLTGGKYGNHAEDEQYIWYANYLGNYILRIDKQNERIEWVKITLPSIYEEWFLRKKEGEYFPYWQEKAESIKRLMDTDGEGEINDVDIKEATGVGELIWRAMKDEKYDVDSKRG